MLLTCFFAICLGAIAVLCLRRKLTREFVIAVCELIAITIFGDYLLLKWIEIFKVLSIYSQIGLIAGMALPIFFAGFLLHQLISEQHDLADDEVPGILLVIGNIGIIGFFLSWVGTILFSILIAYALYKEKKSQQTEKKPQLVKPIKRTKQHIAGVNAIKEKYPWLKNSSK